MQRQPLPQEATACALALLPKPGRPSKRPQDLRPLGLQDPASKVYACLLRDKLEPYLLPWLSDKPQYAYIPGRSIDEAVLRACRNCDVIRDTLRRSAVTVHSQRQGTARPKCTGGAVLSLDLSRAFDALPRAVLAQSLRNAGVPASLCNAVLDVHEQCQYSIQHQRHAGTFSMEKGVRQGCVLSPLLFAAFTGHFFQLLQARTSEAWAAKWVTLFADDTLLQWQITEESDLQFLCRSVRATFRLFTELGMTVNASKSRLLLSLRGGVAKRWLRCKRHRTPTGHIISLGMPAEPICIPHVDSATYLGVELSLDSYELRSCRLRLKLAGGIRQRLLKLLHTPGLGLRTRLTMYVACVRSSTQYGLHAVGLTSHTSRLLDQRDARYLRAISRSPSHITRESTDELRRRLKVASPLQALCKMLNRRAEKCASAVGREAFAQLGDRLRLLHDGTADDTRVQGALIEVDACNPVACNICGQYFSSMRHMKSHRTRQHGKTPKPPMPASLQYVSHTVDGMPQCLHCLRLFTRVEGLKKHLRAFCIKLQYQ